MIYDNISRRGIRSSTSPNPKVILEDIDQKVRRLDPEATPLQTLGQMFGRGAKPKNHKIQVVQYYGFDHYDYASSCYAGNEMTDKSWKAFGRLKLDQPTRPTTRGQMWYQPRDKFYIVSTGQTVEAMLTENAAAPLTDSKYFSCPSKLAGTGVGEADTATASSAGTLVVKTLTGEPLADFTTSDVIFLGNAIPESDRIRTDSHQRDVLFDCNFVEHKEVTLRMTEDQKNLVQTLYKSPDWNFQQTETLQEFKKSIEYNAFFGERAVEFIDPERPTRHMRGLINAIQTNLAYYNPESTDDFELMFSNFLFEQAFRYNPNGYNKIAVCGGRFLHNFNYAFKDYRRSSDLEVNSKKMGLNIQSYEIPGGFSVKLMRSEILRQNTPLENWCFIIDPAEAEWRLVKDYSSRMFANNDERDAKFMIEWQGSIAWHLEQSHALLRTA